MTATAIKAIVTTAQLKALVKRGGLSVSAEKAVGYTRAAKRTTQGIRFEWENDETAKDSTRETSTHIVNAYPQVLVLTSVPRDTPLSSATDYAEREADKDAESLAGVLKDAGLSFKRKGRAFAMTDFTRILEEGWGKKVNGYRMPSYKKPVYPEGRA